MSPEGRAAAEAQRDLRVRRAFLDASRLSGERLADHLAALPKSIASEVLVLLKLVAEDLADSRTDDRDPHDWFDRTIGPWRLGIELGSGGHGRVLRATSADGTSAAVKVLSVSGDDLSARLEREVAALGGLDHPGIVRVLDHGVVEMAVGSDDRTVAYLAMDLVDGGEAILDWIARVRPDRATRIDLVERLLEPLAHAHARGVVHRDLKSSNVLADDDGRPHFIDFGIARIVDGDGRGTGLHATETRDRHAIVGSLAHLAPEQVDRRLGPISPATDVHAIGLLAYRMLCGEPPYDATGSVVQVIQAVLHVPPADPVIFDPEMPREIADWLERCLAKAPNERPADAGAALEMWRTACHQFAGGDRESNTNPNHLVGRVTGEGHGIRVAVAVITVIGMIIGIMAMSFADPNTPATSNAGAGDSDMRMRSFLGSVVGGAMVSGVACAQDAVQWRVEDGGNGHWYQVVTSGPISWSDAKASSTLAGGHLVSLTTEAEGSFVWAMVDVPECWERAMGPWIGASQSRGASEPFGGWSWVTEEQFDHAEWSDDNPDNDCEGSPEGFAMYWGTCCWPSNSFDRARQWNDFPDSGCLGYRPISFVIEWSADCNEDGIVDYGQILDGTLVDGDDNGVPDICEVLIFDHYEDAILDSEPIAYWRMDIDGGVVRNMIEGSPAAVVIGGPGESDSPVGCVDDPSLTMNASGSLQIEDDDRFDLDTLGEFAFEVWMRVEPSGSTQFVLSKGRDVDLGTWDLRYQPENDGFIVFRINNAGCCPDTIIPYPAEMLSIWCHVVGVVRPDSLEQEVWINGELVSTAALSSVPQGNNNYPFRIGRHGLRGSYEWPFNGSIDEVAIYDRALTADEILGHYLSADPDRACAQPCVGNFTQDEIVDAADLGILLAVWGDASAYPQADLNGDGTVNAADLGILLSGWGPCPE